MKLLIWLAAIWAVTGFRGLLALVLAASAASGALYLMVRRTRPSVIMAATERLRGLGGSR